MPKYIKYYKQYFESPRLSMCVTLPSTRVPVGFAGIAMLEFEMKYKKTWHVQSAMFVYLLVDCVMISGFYKLRQDTTFFLFALGVLVASTLTFRLVI